MNTPLCSIFGIDGGLGIYCGRPYTYMFRGTNLSPLEDEVKVCWRIMHNSNTTPYQFCRWCRERQKDVVSLLVIAAMHQPLRSLSTVQDKRAFRLLSVVQAQRPKCLCQSRYSISPCCDFLKHQNESMLGRPMWKSSILL